jgi:hypothetical protein
MNPSSDNMQGVLLNPFYAIDLAEELFAEKPMVAKEDWVLTNTKLIDDQGEEVWLTSLLNTLSAHSEHVEPNVNPALAVSISDRLRGEHTPLVTRAKWIEANVNVMEESGVEQWLWQLLGVLETGGPTE